MKVGWLVPRRSQTDALPSLEVERRWKDASCAETRLLLKAGSSKAQLSALASKQWAKREMVFLSFLNGKLHFSWLYRTDYFGSCSALFTSSKVVQQLQHSWISVMQKPCHNALKCFFLVENAECTYGRTPARRDLFDLMFVMAVFQRHIV